MYACYWDINGIVIKGSNLPSCRYTTNGIPLIQEHWEKAHHHYEWDILLVISSKYQ